MLIDLYIAFAIALTAVGLFVWSWLNFRKGRKTLSWKRVKGEVVSSSSEQTGVTAEFDHPTYTTRAVVRYEVDGTTYFTSNVDDFVGSVESIGNPGTIPPESRVTVYYNPENPQEAVLDRAALRFSIILACLAGGFVALEWHWINKSFF